MAKQEKSAAELYREERKARIAKAAKKNAKKSHKIILTKGAKAAIAVVVVIAIAAGIGVFAINNSGVLERNKVAFNIGDVEVSAPEYGYYYNSIFSNMFNYSYQYDSYGAGMGKIYTGFDWSVSPDAQPYTIDELEGVEDPMFTDYFDYSAKESLKYVKASLKYAEENGITLDEEDMKSVEETMASVEEAAASSNYSVPAYLRAFYGKGMTKNLLRQICEEQTLATKVQTVKTQEFGDAYKAEEIEKEYKKNIETYGEVSLRLYMINAEKVEVPAEEEGKEPTKETTKETMAAAKTKADSFAAQVSTPENFKATAAEFEKQAGNESYKDLEKDDSKTLVKDTTYGDLSYDITDEKFLKWAIDENTKPGETYVVENEGVGYSVYMMEVPVHKAADDVTYDVRHILIKFPEEDSAEDSSDSAEDAEEEKKEEVEVELLNPADYDVTVDIDVDLEKTGDKALYKEAQAILEDYLAGGKTEDEFAALAAKHSADGNAQEGGIYEDVTLGYMVPEFEGWAIEEGRQYGDVGIVETTYGYHIMYFIGTETTTWEQVIRNDLGAEKYNTFSEELAAGDNVKIDGIVEAELKNVEEFVVKLAKQQIRALQQQQGATY